MSTLVAAASAPRAAPAGTAVAGRERVVIIGAGITGLVLSARLARRGVPHVVLERRAEPGGVIRSSARDSAVLEHGPQRTRLTPAVRALVDELGLAPQLLTAPSDLPLFVYRAGALRLAPLTLAQLLATDLLSARARLRLLAEPFTAPLNAQETVADYFARRFGRTAYVDLLGPLFGGLYASDPENMLARHALLPALLELGARRSAVLAVLRRGFARRKLVPACSFRSGMQALTDALHHHVREHVRLATPAVRIEARADGLRVHAGDAELSARAVVLTCPAAEAAVLLGDIAPAAGTALAELAYNKIAIVHLRSEARLHGMGYQVSFSEPLRTRGVTFNHALFGRNGIYTAFLGGARDARLEGESDAHVGEIALREFRDVTGASADVLGVSRTAVPAWDLTWTALEGIRLPRGVHLCTNYESRIGIPGRIRRAIEVADAL